ncbi:MAG TPA: hypothetical protein VEB86_03315 [Chryseosolibacter sp.]|nr:hypothetical protein [Chryseosolibacter sp.]
MKAISYLLLILMVYPFSQESQQFVGSTPADSQVRQFLGIPENVAVDFIRWKLDLKQDSYQLNCSYGVGKPNTNGFEVEQRIAVRGDFEMRGTYYKIRNGEKELSFAVLNKNMLHPVDEKRKLIPGNGGFSYTLSSTSSLKSAEFSLRPKEDKLPPKMVFEGRTPCGELATIIGLGRDCYKLKWRIIFYSDSVNGKPSHVEMMATGFRKDGLLKGDWVIVKSSDGRLMYRIKPETYDYQLDLLKADEGVLLFTDGKGNLLVGNADFSYTLNRVR